MHCYDGIEEGRDILREVRAAGFVHVRSKGSHSVWRHSDRRQVTILDGPREVAGGTYLGIMRVAKKEE